MSWGTSSWGGSVYGLGAVVPFDFVSAHARGELVVRVEVSRSALASDPVGVGDALNPRTWGVVCDDAVFTVLSVRRVDTLVVNTVFELYLLQKLGKSGITHTVYSDTLRAINGFRPVASNQTADFDGCRAALDTAQVTRNTLVDLAKPQLNDGQGGAVFRVGASGDYDVESGKELLRKLFYRRITTVPGGFFHMTSYGLGVRLKEPMTTPRMVSLKNDIQRTIALEPEVDSVAASVRATTGGMLVIVISARLISTGTSATETFMIPTVSL